MKAAKLSLDVSVPSKSKATSGACALAVWRGGRLVTISLIPAAPGRRKCALTSA
jgi:hypothetical protein